ncbi:DUF6296 family protein [Kitasatospora griseola]|uniref:DUF6296 family protein n=1 Tax=Kitasatospora griseola TaxID=2064 RepID=UPI00364CD8FA
MPPGSHRPPHTVVVASTGETTDAGLPVYTDTGGVFRVEIDGAAARPLTPGAGGRPRPAGHLPGADRRQRGSAVRDRVQPPHQPLVRPRPLNPAPPTARAATCSRPRRPLDPPCPRADHLCRKV